LDNKKPDRSRQKRVKIPLDIGDNEDDRPGPRRRGALTAAQHLIAAVTGGGDRSGIEPGDL